MSEIKLNSNLIKKDLIEVSLSKEQLVTETNMTDLMFDLINIKVGKNLNLQNGKIKIGKDISAIKVTYTLWIENEKGYSAHYITKNGEIMSYNIDARKNDDARESWHTSTGYAIIPVIENDLIGIAVRFSESSSLNKLAFYTNSNRLIVEAI